MGQMLSFSITDLDALFGSNPRCSLWFFTSLHVFFLITRSAGERSEQRARKTTDGGVTMMIWVTDRVFNGESMTESTWVNAKQSLSVEETETRAETLVDQLKSMAANAKGNSKQIINMVIEKGPD